MSIHWSLDLRVRFAHLWPDASQGSSTAAWGYGGWNDVDTTVLCGGTAGFLTLNNAPAKDA